MRVEFVVHGSPAVAGSKRRVPVPGTGGARFNTIDDDTKVGPWKQNVAQRAGEAWAGRALLDGPVRLRVVFYRPRPQSHYRANGDLRPSAPAFPITKPDATKQLRAVEDALKGVVWTDDARVVDQHAFKRYGTARAEVAIESMDGEAAPDQHAPRLL